MDRQSAWQLYETEQGPLRGWAGSIQDSNLQDLGLWWLVRRDGEGSTAWLARGGPANQPALFLSPMQGGASWLSKGIPVNAGERYRFVCSMKREGERHWAHACDVNWISLVFEDDQGVPCRMDPEWDQPMIQVRCRNTQGWIKTSRSLSAPAGASFLRIGFRIDRGEPFMGDPYGFRRFWHGCVDTGKWWISGVDFSRIQVGSSRGGLLIEQPQGGARMRLVGPDNRTFFPEDSVVYEDGGECFHLKSHEVEMGLEPGEYTLEAMRGFRRSLYTGRIHVREGHLSRVCPVVDEIEPWQAGTWREGDHHNHLSFHGSTRYPLMSIDDVFRIARGEGLDYLSFCGEIVDQHAFADWRERGQPLLARPDGTYASSDFVSAVSHEVTQDLLGHVCVVHGPGHLEPGHPWWVSPTNAGVSRRVRQGDASGTIGAMVLAHPYHGVNQQTLWDVLPDAEKTCLQREMPVDVALGWADTMDFLSVEEPEDLDIRFRDYFRFLNLGLMIGVSGASDAYADQGTEIVGSLRTVVQADLLDMNEIARGYRSRRTMATNGPLLRLTVNGKGPGDRARGPGIQICCLAHSNWGLCRLQIMSSVGVLADASPEQDGWIRLEVEGSMDRSGWLVARVWGPGHPSLNMRSIPEGQRNLAGQWCVTSPIWVDVDERPLLPLKEDARYFIRWIDASCEAIRNRTEVLRNRGPHGPELRQRDVDEALSLFAQGRRVYEGLLNAAAS